jgi:serine/threonine protein kinase
VSSSEESQIVTDSDVSSVVDSQATDYWNNSSDEDGTSDNCTSESTTQKDRKFDSQKSESRKSGKQKTEVQQSENFQKSAQTNSPKIEINDVSQKENISPTDNILGNSKNFKKVIQQQETNYLFIVMEFCSGGSLRSWLDDRSFFKINLNDDKNSGWNYFQCHNYLVQICEAVSYLHKQRCIHRDIKPGNIMFDGKPNANAKNQALIKLCDFGLSRQDAEDSTTSPASDMSKSTLNKSLISSRYNSNAHIRLPSMLDVTKGVGTRLYMAPELLEKRSELMSKSGSWSKNSGCTGAVDIYGIGLVAIEMFSDFNTRIERMIILEGARHSGMDSVKKL